MIYVAIGFVSLVVVLVALRRWRSEVGVARRLRSNALHTLFRPTVVTIRGKVRGFGVRIEAPISRRACVAYVAVDAAGEEVEQVTRFFVNVDGEYVLVEVDSARLLVDRKLKAGAPEVAIADGDEVVVRGRIARLDKRVASTFRGAAEPTYRITGTFKEPVVVVMPPDPAHATRRWWGRYGWRMSDMKPLIYVPKSSQVSQMVEAAPLSIEPRAQRVGVAIIAPRVLRPADLMVACHFWPKALREANVSRVAVVLGVESYVTAQPIVAACKCRMHEQGITVEYFHEAHLESDQLRAWFEQRQPKRRVTSDTLVKLSQRYAARGDIRAAQYALRIAEAAATFDEPKVAAPSPTSLARTVAA